MKGQAGFTVVEMVIGLALMAFVSFAGYMALSTFEMTANTQGAGLASRQDAYTILERFRTTFNATGSGWNKRVIAPQKATFVQQVMAGDGKFVSKASSSYETRCQGKNEPGFPAWLKSQTLPPVGSLCADLKCGKGSRPVVIERHKGKAGATSYTFPVKSPGKNDGTVAMAMCFSQSSGYLSVEVWSALRRGKSEFRWERQQMLVPTTISVSGNVNYLPPKD